MTNEERGEYGYTAVRAGAPDVGKNADFPGDPEGVRTDAGDAIANVLHYVFQSSPADSLDEREAFALSALAAGERHFKAELRGEL